MSANFTPTLHTYKMQGAFRYWVQKVLPLVYDDSLSYYELLNKVVDYLNNMMEDENNLIEDITSLRDAFVSLQNYVNDYFANLDVSAEVQNAVDELVDNGTIEEMIDSFMGDEAGAYIYSWLNEHPEATTTVQDGSITNAKLVQSGGILSDVIGLKEALDYTHATNITYPADGVTYTTIENDTQHNWNPIPDTTHPVSLPDHGGFPIGANHVFVFGCQIEIDAGTTIRACDIKARLINTDQNITIDCLNSDHYHWTLGENTVTVFFRFDVLGVFPLPSPSVDAWVVYLDFYNSVDAPDGINHMYITVHNPYFVDYTGVPHVQQISDYFQTHWTEEFVDCTRIWNIEQSINSLSETVASIQIDAVPPLSSADIATIIGNVN